jgi:uroporphyrinogen-III synthase
MAVNRLVEVADQLFREGWPGDTPVIIGERIGYRDENLVASDLGRLGTVELQVPAVVLVGVKAYPPTPASLFVGTDPEHFLKHGPLIHWPLIRLVARPLDERVAHLRQHLAGVKGLILPGRYAVRAFMEALMQEQDARALAGKRLLAVGPATAEELASFGLTADRAAPSMGGIRDLVQALTNEDRGRYLYPCSDAAPREERTRALAEYGVELVPCIFYNNRAMPVRDLPRLPFARVIFTSTSTVKAYFKNYPREREASRTWIAVGPSTLKALTAEGVPAELLPE